MQRHLQHSLEVHQRYIHRLMEQEGLAHKIPEMSAALQAGAAAQPASLASEAMSVQPLQRAGSLQQPIDQQQQQHARSNKRCVAARESAWLLSGWWRLLAAWSAGKTGKGDEGAYS